MVAGAPAPNLLCPLCGGANACAPAQSGSFDSACWCTTVPFDAELLARVPEAERGMSCICRACVASATAGARGAAPG